MSGRGCLGGPRGTILPPTVLVHQSEGWSLALTLLDLGSVTEFPPGSVCFLVGKRGLYLIKSRKCKTSTEQPSSPRRGQAGALSSECTPRLHFDQGSGHEVSKAPATSSLKPVSKDV